MPSGLVSVAQLQPNSGWADPQLLDPVRARQIIPGCNQDGQLELFLIELTSNQVYQMRQTAPGAGFASKVPLGITAQQLALAANKDGRLEFVYIGTNSSINHRWQNAPNSDVWTGQGLGGQAKQITLASNADGRLESFYIGMDNNIYHSWQNTPGSSAWSGSTLRGQAKQINLIANHDGRLEIVYIGMDDGLYHNWQTAANSQTWGGGGSGATAAGLGGKAREITTVVNKDGRLETFYVGFDGKIYHNWQKTPGGDWNGSALLGGWGVGLCPCHDQDGRLELFYVGPDGCIYQWWQSSLNGPWTGGVREKQANTIASITAPDGRIHVFYAGSDQPPPLPAELTFEQQIVFDSGTAAGGWTKLVVRQDGTFSFTGHIHDSGAISYNTAVAFALKDTNNVAYTITHSGSVKGTLSSGSRDDDWSVDGKNDDVAKNWASIVDAGQSFPPSMNAKVNWDAVDVLNLSLAVLGTILSVVGLNQSNNH